MSKGPGSARKKKRQRRNSQGDGRHRKPSTSSVCSSDYDQKDLEEEFETMNFDDLEERKQSPVREAIELGAKKEGTINMSENLLKDEDYIILPESG